MKKILLCLATGSANAEMTDGSISPSLLARAGTGGGNVPMIVETLVFDEGQITCPTNGSRPEWGGAATPCRETPHGQS